MTFICQAGLKVTNGRECEHCGAGDDDVCRRLPTIQAAEIERLRAINAELVRIVLDDTEGDLDFVKFKVRALFKCKLQP